MKRLLETSPTTTRSRRPSNMMRGAVAMVIQRQIRKKMAAKKNSRTPSPAPSLSPDPLRNTPLPALAAARAAAGGRR